MKKVMPYQDLNHALKYFRTQVSEGIPWAMEETPAMSSPEKIFNYLKKRTRYKKDPRGRELFQRIDTLLTEGNRHGIVGAGDCDCFTIAALSTLLANGFTDCGIVLAGRNPLTPVHIWGYVNDKGQQKDFDLTCNAYDKTRPYPFTQKIPYRINQEEKNMILELAEGVEGKASYHPYIHFPNKGIQVREDYFDNMSAGEFQHLMLEEGIDVPTLEELSSRRSERKKEKTERKAAKPKNQRKMEKQKRRTTRAEGKASLRTSRGQSKIDKANNPGRESFATQFGKVATTVSKFIPQKQEPDYQGIPEEFTQPEPEEEETFEVPDEMVMQPEEAEMSEGFSGGGLLAGLALSALTIGTLEAVSRR